MILNDTTEKWNQLNRRRSSRSGSARQLSRQRSSWFFNLNPNDWFSIICLDRKPLTPPSLQGVNVVNDVAIHRRSRRPHNGLDDSRFALSIKRNNLNTTLTGLPRRFAPRNDARACGFGFTMAEILLSLTIIGVVAAITLPSLTGNINERTWNTQRKALYARFSQALALMPNLNGYGKYSGTNTDGVVSITEDTAAETFVTEGLSKVMKINNVCDADHLEDCGIVSSYTNLAGSQKAFPKKLSELNSMFTSTYSESMSSGGYDYYTNPQKNIDTKAAAFETQNGESIAVYYNPNCTADTEGNIGHYSQLKMCANFIYDLNGNKGPNTVGKDIGFVTALYPSDPIVVAPVPLTVNASGTNAEGQSTTTVPQAKAGTACTTLDNESRLPNRDELSSMFYNKELISLTSRDYWSGSVISADAAWKQDFITGRRYPGTRSNGINVRCIKR